MAMRDSFNPQGEEWYPWLFAEHVVSFENLFHLYFPLVKKTDSQHKEENTLTT